MRILLVDDHTVLRETLARALSWEPDIEIVGEAGDGKLAVAMTCELLPDIVLMDISMPVMNGFEATRLICAACPGVRVIGLSRCEQGGPADAMRAAGAVAYVDKNDALDVLLAAIRACNPGRRAPPDLARQP